MLHSSRIWSLETVDLAERLAFKLSNFTWTCCQAFELSGYIFANDATSVASAQEYAVLRRSPRCPDWFQIESITFSWCNELRALELIKLACAGEFDAESFCNVTDDRFQTFTEHVSCLHCV